MPGNLFNKFKVKVVPFSKANLIEQLFRMCEEVSRYQVLDLKLLAYLRLQRKSWASIWDGDLSKPYAHGRHHSYACVEGNYLRWRKQVVKP